MRSRRHFAASCALLLCASFVACSLLAPSDEYFFGEAQRPSSTGGSNSGGNGGAPADGGMPTELAGSGGEGEATGGVNSAGAAGNDAGGGDGGSGGEPVSPCQGDLREENGVCVSLSGCSDGAREGFLPVSAWLTLAGCTAKWPRASLRAAKTGQPCGYELGPCATPADACGAGWHVCATPPYDPTEISNQATAEECAAQPGAFAAAVGDQSCEPCSESEPGVGAACCGNGCVQQNGSCIYPGQTAWFGVINSYVNVCGAIESELVQRGVLCCRDH